MIKVIKRNGTVVPFDKEKIILAVTKAYFGEETPWYTNAIVRKIHNFAKKNGNYIDVEEIQNEIGAIYTLVGETSTHLNNLIADNAAEIESLWKALEANKSELKAEITENYNAIVELNSNLATLHTLVKTRLTSLLFAPSYYVDGIEAIPFRTLKYNPWINLMTANEGQETKELTLSDGTTQAAYFASPSTIDLSAIEGYNVLLNDASNLKSRATDAITATFNSFKDGKLIVDLKKNSSEVFVSCVGKEAS